MSFPSLVTVLRDHFESYGEINQWVPLPSFGRVIIVYDHKEEAEEAKLQWDALMVRLKVQPKEQYLYATTVIFSFTFADHESRKVTTKNRLYGCIVRSPTV